MKLGTEKKGELIALVVLLLVAGFMLWRTFAPDSGPAPTPVATGAVAPAAGGTGVPMQLDPTLHMAKLDKLRALDYTGSGRDLFHFGTEPAITQKPALTKAQAAAQARLAATTALPPRPSGPPPPPPIPLQFYGFATANGMPEKIFLKQGQDDYMVSQGDTVEHRYLILSIGKVSVRVKDLQTQSEQDLPLQTSG